MLDRKLRFLDLTFVRRSSGQIDARQWTDASNDDESEQPNEIQ